MENKRILENFAMAIAEGDEDKAKEISTEVLNCHIDPLEAVQQGLSKGMANVGEQFEKGDAYLPELLAAANAYNAAMQILRPEIEAQKKESSKTGTVLIGTVKGDIHSIGKDIVTTVLGTHGFEVIDMGVDNQSLNIIQEAEKVKADVIALSSLLTTTMPYQKEVIEILKETGLRDKYFVIVGGGPVTQEWAEQIGADGYGETAVDAALVAKNLLADRKK